ncbi:MAG: cytidine deaminase [Anaerolineae bacterium]
MDDSLHTLVHSAADAARNAYIPYSHYRVGAALRTKGGTVYTGCNVENAAYPVTICAERVALVKAVSEGERQFDAIAVVTPNGGAPCGMCRQMLYEFAPDLRVILARTDGTVVYDGVLSDLLPSGFGPESLPDVIP